MSFFVYLYFNLFLNNQKLIFKKISEFLLKTLLFIKKNYIFFMYFFYFEFLKIFSNFFL